LLLVQASLSLLPSLLPLLVLLLRQTNASLMLLLLVFLLLLLPSFLQFQARQRNLLHL
jgi:hypothetical protein